MAIDIQGLWDFEQPALSEARFRAALADASAEERLILQTQIARSYVLRGDLARAMGILESMADEIVAAGVEAQVRYELERGRAQASPTHPPETLTWRALAEARQAFERAFRRAKAAERDALAIEALHGWAFTETDPQRQLDLEQDALRFIEHSSQETAQRWGCAIRIGIAQALIKLQRQDEAIAELQAAALIGERLGATPCPHHARWLLGWIYRMMGRVHDALELQLRLEQAVSSPYLRRAVFDELERLYRALSDDEQAHRYRAKALALSD